MRYVLLLVCLGVFAAASGQQGHSGHPAGQRLLLGRITITGNNTTRSRVLLRELNIAEGDYLSADSLELLKAANKLRLMNLQLFNEVEQQITDTAGTITWHIQVKERWFVLPTGYLQYADRNFNTWWVDQGHDLRRVTAGLTITDRNFRGALETLSATLQVGFTEKIALSYLIPYLNNGQNHGIGIMASAARSQQAYYTTDSNKLAFTGSYNGPHNYTQTEAGLVYVYRPAYAARHVVQASYKQYTVADTVRLLNPEYYLAASSRARFLELYYRYEYNGVDNWSYSLRGKKLVAQVVARTGMEGIRFQSFAHVEAGKFGAVAPGWYYAAVFRGRLMVPGIQPYYFRSGLGTQTDYVRGYEYYIIDGSNYGLVRLSLKRQLWNHTFATRVKYATAIPLRMYPKLFADAGYIVSPQPGNSYLSNQLLYSIGVGLDIVSLYDIKFRIELAWNHLAQRGVYLHNNSE